MYIMFSILLMDFSFYFGFENRFDARSFFLIHFVHDFLFNSSPCHAALSPIVDIRHYIYVHIHIHNFFIAPRTDKKEIEMELIAGSTDRKE